MGELIPSWNGDGAFTGRASHSLRRIMAKDNGLHPVLIITCFVLLGITIGTAVAMEKFPFSPTLDTTELEAEDLLPRGSGSLRPGIDVK